MRTKSTLISKEWPKDQKWLVRRIKVIKQNLQQELGIEIRIERNPKNTSLIKIEKNVSDVSGEHKMSPENESLTPYFEEMSPEKDRMSPDNQDDASTNPLTPETMETPETFPRYSRRKGMIKSIAS